MNQFHHTLPGWQWPADGLQPPALQGEHWDDRSHELLVAILELDRLLDSVQERLSEQGDTA